MLATKFSSKNKLHIHMIGVCGCGMNGVAVILKSLGHIVSGSDMNPNTKVGFYLQKIGVEVSCGHKAKNIKSDIDLVIYSGAIKVENIEFKVAMEQGIECINRAMAVSKLIEGNNSIAVSGTHGKTTTTSMVQSIFSAANKDPSYIVGGGILGKESGASLGGGDIFIIEADESDASFKEFYPTDVVVTNIDKEHMQTYDNDIELLKKAYLDFIHNTPSSGRVILCLEDENIKTIVSKIDRQIVTYGLSNTCDVYASDINYTANKTSFLLHYEEKKIKITVSIVGECNVLNTLAACSVAVINGISLEEIQSGMSEFVGVRRRFNLYKTKIDFKEIVLIDDYGHHPTEIKETLNSIHTIYPNRRVIAVFQPHKYSRTKELFIDFIEQLERSDILILQETYSAGEEILVGYESSDICSSIPNSILVDNNETAFKKLKEIIKKDDVVLVQGAGNIADLAILILNK